MLALYSLTWITNIANTKTSKYFLYNLLYTLLLTVKIMSNQRESRMAALASEAELWEYLHFHGETEDFERWVIGYRQSLEDENK